jgi:KaiC/GvpD/RAD55 family RecA-like ATPase
MNVIDFLSTNGVRYINKERDNVYIECPHCGKDSLSIHALTGKWHCWQADCEASGAFAELAEALELDPSGVDLKAQSEVPKKDKRLDEDAREAINRARLNKTEVIQWAASRSLDGAFCISQGIGYDKAVDAIVFPFRHPISGEIIGAKYRSLKNKDQWIKGEEPALFVLDPADLRKDKVVIVEGEVDAIQLKQFGLPVVATLGASKDKGFDLLGGVRAIILGYDMDDAGEAGVEKAVSHLGRFRCRRVKWGAKDPNDWIRSGAVKQDLIEALRNAEPLTSDITSLSAKDALSVFIKEQEQILRKRRSWGFPKLDSFTHGITGGTLVGVLAEAGTGKTTFLINVIRNHIAQGIKCGFASLEEHPIYEITPKLYSVIQGRNIGGGILSHADPQVESMISMVQYYDKDPTLETLADWIKECYYTHDCKMVAIDYFQLLISDETNVQAVKETIFGLKKLVKEMHDLTIIIIIQPKQYQKTRTKEGKEAQPMKLDGASARGGAAINQTVDMMLTIKGVEGHPNITQYEYTKVRGHLRVSKKEWLNQFTQLEYDHLTLRMSELQTVIYGG